MKKQPQLTTGSEADAPGIKTARGQGVVEYAGALVIAAMIVSIVMFVVPDQVSSLINDIVTSAITYFTGQLPS